MINLLSGYSYPPPIPIESLFTRTVNTKKPSLSVDVATAPGGPKPALSPHLSPRRYFKVLPTSPRHA